MAGNTGTPGATVVGRVLAVLAAFDETHPRLTMSAEFFWPHSKVCFTVVETQSSV